MNHRAVIGLGANLGDPLVAVQHAVDLLSADPMTKVLALSPLYATSPVGGPEQPDYLNAVAIVKTKRSAEELLALAHDIEHAHHRLREVRWGPRTLDVDIIDFDGVVRDDPELTLPHPRAHERAFVLWPWHAVDPDATIIGRGAVSELAEAIADQSVERLDIALVVHP